MTASQQGATSQRRAPEGEEAFRTAEGPDAEELKLWKAGPRYEIIRKLGSGSYGTVFEAKDTQGDRAVAVKRVELIDDPTHFRRTLRELCLLGMLRGHCNIVELLDVVAPLQETGGFDEIYLVMERCKLDLRKFFRSDHTVTTIQAQRILYTAARGLAYLHSGGIWHRDLKPDNLLMNSDCEVKIADYGLSRAVGWCDFRRAGLDGEPEDPLMAMFHLKARPEEQLTIRVCTRWYRAPELLLGQSDYTEAVDVWSLGCIFAELLQCLTGFPPCDRKGPLFPGDYCRRPGRDRVDQVVQMPTPSRRAARDMLELVFDVIGTPSDLDLGLLRREKDRKHISSFPRRDGCGIRARVPEADDDALDVLGRVLIFSASDRATARDLLALPFFDQVREVEKERIAPGVLNLRFEEEPDDMQRLEPYLVKEIQRYQKLD